MIAVDLALLKELFGLSQIGGWVWIIWRISHIEHMLGNGKPGVFIRRREVELMKGAADKEHDRLEHELDKVWEALGKVRE